MKHTLALCLAALLIAAASPLHARQLRELAPWRLVGQGPLPKASDVAVNAAGTELVTVPAALIDLVSGAQVTSYK